MFIVGVQATRAAAAGYGRWSAQEECDNRTSACSKIFNTFNLQAGQRSAANALSRVEGRTHSSSVFQSSPTLCDAALPPPKTHRRCGGVVWEFEALEMQSTEVLGQGRKHLFLQFLHGDETQGPLHAHRVFRSRIVPSAKRKRNGRRWSGQYKGLWVAIATLLKRYA